MSAISPHEYSEREGTANVRARAVLICVFVSAAGYFWWSGNGSTFDGQNAADSKSIEAPDTAASPTRQTIENAELRGRFARQLAELSVPLQRDESKRLAVTIVRVTNRLNELGDAEFENPAYEHAFETSLESIGTSIRALGTIDNKQLGTESKIETQIADSIEREAKRREEIISQTIKTASEKVELEHDVELRAARLKELDLKDRVATLRAQLSKAIRDSKDNVDTLARAAALQRDMATVRAYLSPFITPGHVQPRSRSNAGDIEHTVEKVPVSYTRLERLGAFEPTIAGLHQLYRFGGSNNDRPRGSFPRYGWEGEINNASIRASVQKAQDLIRTHKQALLDAHLLSP